MKISFLLLICAVIHYTLCLRNVRLIFPDAVPEGGVAVLLCLYELQQGEQLYSVKWYRGTYEIYRYLPTEIPKIRIFPLRGLYIDIGTSNAHRLTLLDVPRHLRGNYTCEVTVDSAFTTDYVTEFLQIVVKNTTAQEETSHENYEKLDDNSDEQNAVNVGSTVNKMDSIYVCMSIVIKWLFGTIILFRVIT